MVLHFCTFLLNPHFDLEPDHIVRKPIKRRFQRYIVRMEIFSTFHARVEYNRPTLFRPFKPMGLTAHRHTKVKHNLRQFHSVHLADIIKQNVSADRRILTAASGSSRASVVGTALRDLTARRSEIPALGKSAWFCYSWKLLDIPRVSVFENTGFA